MQNLRALLALAFTLLLAQTVSASDEPTLEQRLATLEERLEEARVREHVPGMSIAIVQDDEVVFARGFGSADVDSGRAADEGTIYAIGSTTKAFTSTLVGMLVDDGALGWDDPARSHLPYFELAVRSDDEDAACTLRDLLSHRHGFTRMSILWLSGDVSREDILRTAAGAEPWDDFRKNFHYCNVTYLAAGEAAGAAAGRSWNELMSARIFEPLGMSSSSLSAAVARKDPRLALGYEWDAARERTMRRPMVELETIGPAGAVNSNVLDMAQWLRLQLGRGEVDGVRLVSSERLLETWQPQIAINDDVSYGLGWMLREHEGRKVVEHGGNIDGFSAQVTLVPEESLGYVLLMNQGASLLREPSLGLVLDAMLDAPTPAPVADPALVLEDFVGTYVANFLSFRDAEFEVALEGEGLVLHIPGQGETGLSPPDAEGMWKATRDASVALSFGRDDGGDVVGCTLHNDGFHFDLPRKGLALPPEPAADGLEPYVGGYVRVRGGREVEIAIVRGRLTLLDRGKELAFETPDSDGHAALRARADFGATFRSDAQGNVVSFVFHGSAGDRLFRRQSDAAASALPSVDEVLALRDTEGRVTALAASGGIRMSGEVWVAQAGVRGTFTTLVDGSERSASHLDFGKFGHVGVVVDGGDASSYNPLRGFEELLGHRRTQALLAHPFAIEGDWRAYFDSIEVVRADQLEGRAVHVVRLTQGDLPSRAYWVDAANGDVLRVTAVALEGPVRVPITTDFSEFDELGGIRRARRVEIENPATGRTVLTISRVETELEFGDDAFVLEDPSATIAPAAPVGSGD